MDGREDCFHLGVKAVVRGAEGKVFEETGLEIRQVVPLVMVLPGVRVVVGERVRLSEEHQEYLWVLPEEAAEMLAGSVSAELIEKIVRVGQTI